MSDRTNVLTVAPSDRESMHEFIDRLGDEEAKRIRRIMAAATGNPLLRSLLLAEYDDVQAGLGSFRRTRIFDGGSQRPDAEETEGL